MTHPMFRVKKVDEQTYVKAGVGLILLNDKGQILFEKRRDCGMWGLPGGKIDAGESIEQTAIREAKEETGFNIQVMRLLGVYSDPKDHLVAYLPSKDVAQLVDIVLEAKIVSGILTTSDESEELRFFDLKALPSEIVPPAIPPLNDYKAGVVGAIR